MPTELEMWLLFGYFVCNVPNKKIKKKEEEKKTGVNLVYRGVI